MIWHPYSLSHLCSLLFCFLFFYTTIIITPYHIYAVTIPSLPSPLSSILMELGHVYLFIVIIRIHPGRGTSISHLNQSTTYTHTITNIHLWQHRIPDSPHHFPHHAAHLQPFSTSLYLSHFGRHIIRYTFLWISYLLRAMYTTHTPKPLWYHQQHDSRKVLIYWTYSHLHT